MNDVTKILSQLESGDPSAAKQLLPLVYDELRKLADDRIRREKPGQTLQATALVHEAYLRLVQPDEKAEWDSRGHFFAAAAEGMRRILIERARKRNRIRHGGDRDRVELEIHCPASQETPDRLLAIEEGLKKLESEMPDVAKLVKIRHFAGASLQDSAALLGISLATAKRRWALARAFLFDELSDEPN